MMKNLLLDVLPEAERKRIAPYCETIPLVMHETLHHADAPVDYVWFPHSGVCSSLVHVSSGEAVEVALVGREGMTGLPLVLGGFATPFHVIVQAPGTATRIAREPFVHDVLHGGHPLCGALLKYANLYMATVAQTAACNRLHRIEQRLARWILDMRVRMDEPVLPITHEMLGLMVGSYRPSITNALSAMEDRGIVRAGRGKLTVTDQSALEQQACECHRAMKARTADTLDRIRTMAA
ncbi:MAG: Crp/Fnr family transcriptional regulator [Candidatus Baltobacteraceae bacterium]